MADTCDKCGAERFSWMGEHHKCLTPDLVEHPYYNWVFPEPPEIDWQAWIGAQT